MYTCVSIPRAGQAVAPVRLACLSWRPAARPAARLARRPALPRQLTRSADRPRAPMKSADRCAGAGLPPTPEADITSSNKI